MDSPNIFLNPTITKLENYTDSHHLPNGHYKNEDGDPCISKDSLQTQGFFKTLSKFAKFFATKPDVTTPLPLRQITKESGEFNQLSEDPQHPLIKTWWLGHASLLIQIDTYFILIDPNLSDYASPVKGFMKRATPPALRVSDLPPISLILYSHDHYDHLSYDTLCQVKEKNPNVAIYAPIGISDMINKWNKDFNAVGLDWRTFVKIPLSDGFIHITFFPARHYTRRSVSDTNERLWGSWLIQVNGLSLYYPGDSAVGPHFSEIRTFVGKPIDIVFMPIGPQNPEEVMRPVHMNPEDARDMAQILEAKSVVPIHYGCFALGQEVQTPDLELLKQLWNGDNLFPVLVGGRIDLVDNRFVPPNEFLI